MSDKRIFEEVEVDCNDCEAYWLNQCDGVAFNSERKCISYIPTKRVDIPVKIQALEKRVDTLNNWVVALCLGLLAELIITMILR